MRLFDLSQPVTDDGPHCPVHPPVRLPRIADHPRDGWRLEKFDMASHTGTHIDAPLHKLAAGGSIDQIALERFTGRAIIADLSDSVADRPVGAAELAHALPSSIADQVVLLNTGWGERRASSDEWHYHSPYLAPDGAQWLVERGIRGLGIDHYSIGGSRDPDNTRTHEIILGAGIWVVEDLCFRDGWREFVAGATFMALPLLLPGFSGSPCRAVLVQMS